MEKGIALLSGGIDSPVAIHLLQNRLEIIAVHFHQLPLTNEKEVEKVKELGKILGLKKLYLIPFTPVLKELVSRCSHKNYFILSKIAMFKAAEIIAEKEEAKFLITGENLGQVSSQTLSNLTTITKNLTLEIFRPVLTYDKQEIIKIAKKISTYETSNGPEICCLLGPKYPATKSEPEEIKKELEKVELRKLLEESLEKAEVVEF
jgi:thiamine biosynthesis protein ThiI